MKKRVLKSVLILVLLMVYSCDEPETVVTNIVHTDGSVTRHVEMRSTKNVFDPSDYRIPVDSSWNISDTIEINIKDGKSDTTWIKIAEKNFGNVEEINKGYSTDKGKNKASKRTARFSKKFKWFNTEFRFSENVTGFLVEGGAVRGVRTDKGEYGGEVVINAAGGQASAVGRLVGLEIPVIPDSHEAAVTEPVARFLDPMVVDIRPVAGSANYYFHQHYTGQIIFCITPCPNIWGEDTRETSVFLPMIARRMVSLMPRLKNIRVRRTWRGLYPMTPDGFPIVGWSREIKGLLLAVGMCGQGFMLGPGLGELLAAMVQDKLSPGDKEILPYISPYRQFASQEKLK